LNNINDSKLNNGVGEKLSDYVGNFINTDGYAYGEMPKLLKVKFNETVINSYDTGRNMLYFTDSGYQVSSNGHVSYWIIRD
jgi:hypothetical protein